MKKITFTGKPPTASATPQAIDAWVAASKTEPLAEATRRFTFDVPASLHKRIKARCVQEDRIMADVIRELLEKTFPPEQQN